MTDEEFYKNIIITILNQHFRKEYVENIDLFMDSHWARKLEYTLKGDEIIDIKRKLIIKEKTWYLTRANDFKYIVAILPTLFDSKPVLTWSGRFNPADRIEAEYYLSGTVWDNDTCQNDLMRECTPEEVKEIEDKLRGKNEEPN